MHALADDLVGWALTAPADPHPDAGDDPEILGLTSDSREVRPGWLFAALPGTRDDGARFIPDALARGAAAIVAAPGTVLPPGARAALITDPNPRRLFARLAAGFFGRQPETVVAVTGTNGKTSTVQFARQIWAHGGERAAAIGTLGITAPGLADDGGGLTTPDPVALFQALAELAQGGVRRLALEASSHGLAQDRLDGVRLNAAAFTNLTRDHLDYHGSMEAYRAAKLQLFRRLLPPGGAAVLNADSPEFPELAALCRGRGHRVLPFGRAALGQADGLALAEAPRPLPHGQELSLELGGRRHAVTLPLVGTFQAWNVLAALGLVIGSGTAADLALVALPHLTGVRGRMERAAQHPNGAAIYVDYAHTPDALETLLLALRPHVAPGGRLAVLFGCGGDRDRGKRPLMGAIARRLADRVIVTDDNPRSEDPAAIRAAILAEVPDAWEIGDRADAIRAAVATLGPGDLLVLAGKGHEGGQTVIDAAGVKHVRPFDDASEARAAVEAL